MRDFGEFSHSRLMEPQIATVSGFDASGVALVALDGKAPAAAESLCPLTDDLVGAKVLVARIAGDVPVILGRLQPPAQMVRTDKGKGHVITAEKELELRCGKARIKLHADGRITLRGTQILSRAEGANRVQGASVQLN